MNDVSSNDEKARDVSSNPSFPEAKVEHRYFSAIWLVPIIAALVAGYLGARSFVERGPEITITFRSGEGLTAGQTPVKYKAVNIGTVQDISLNEDHSGVIVHVRMLASADSMLTDDTRFWVVRPRLNSSNFASLETLVSGTYIAIEPSDQDSGKQTQFTGLESPPNLVSDEPGTTYVLKAEKLGSISAGTPVYFRDVNVGEVIGYDIGDGFGPIKINILIHAPYDGFVKPGSRFWNASGVSLKTSDGGFHVQLQSLQAVLQGGIAFSTPFEVKDTSQASAKMNFTLYDNQKMADAADFTKPVDYVTYLQSTVKDLAPGSPVQIFGVPVGTVTSVKLIFDVQKAEPKVRVTFNVLPDRAFGVIDPKADTGQVAHQLVQSGMRVRLESSEIVLGQEVLSLEFVPNATQADVTMEGDALVLPGQAGGMDHLAEAIGDIAGKLNQIPFDQIGDHLNHLIATADQTLTSSEMQQALHSLTVTLANAEDISKKADSNLTPALQKLPQISEQLQTAISHANEFLAGVNNGYGQDSDFQRNTERVMNEVSEAARSIRLLADFLQRHPEALIQGKTDRSKP